MVATWAIMCGQVRDEAAALQKIDILQNWQTEGVIENAVVSTWIGELEKYPALVERLLRTNFSVVESSPPRLRTNGHALHQSRSVELALDETPDGARVLKLRPDLFNPGPRVKRALSAPPSACDLSGGLPMIFEKRVSVIGGFVGSPFYFNDIQMIGMKNDLRRIFHFDYGMYLRAYNIAPEQFFFSREFTQHFPVFRRYFEFNPGLVFNNPEASYARTAAVLEFQDMVDAAWAFHKAAAAYFAFDIAENEEHRWVKEDEEAVRESSLPEIVARVLPVQGLRTHGGANTNFFARREIIDMLLAGDFRRDPFHERYMEARGRVGDDLRGLPDASDPTAFLEKMNAVARYTPNRQERIGAMKVVLTEPDRPSVMGDDESYKALEAELNNARRTIDRLNAALRDRAATQGPVTS